MELGYVFSLVLCALAAGILIGAALPPKARSFFFKE
jgi:hypothetical protein